MVTRNPGELASLVKAGTASISRANRAASAVLAVVGELNAAQAAFLRSPSVRYQVEMRLVSRYEEQCTPLESAVAELEGELATLAPQHQRILAALKADRPSAKVADGYLRSIVKLSGASVLATAELAAFPDALDQLGERMPSLVPATDRLSPTMKRVLVALQPAVGWGDAASAMLEGG